MILQTAAPVAIVPATQQFRVDLIIDLQTHLIKVIVVQPGSGVPPLVDVQPLGANLQSNLETYAQNRAELLLGVAAGSTTIATP